ncbi:MAG: hypothetical protein LBS43_07970 [Prevotellaceae bacterium]|jgi:hypothetical protein|nr:hypothetical protein [Prevotellaceae bacterium]
MKIWNEIEDATKRYKRLNIEKAIHYKKFYLYLLIAHSTAIEGSTLTEQETKIGYRRAAICYDLIPTKIYVEDKKQYIASLIESSETHNNLPFRMFMASQLMKTLKQEIVQYQKEQQQGNSFSLIF